MYNIRASLQKYKIKKIHQKKAPIEKLYLTTTLTVVSHSTITASIPASMTILALSVIKNCLYDPFSRINLGGIRIFCIFTQKFRDIQNHSTDLGIIHF